MHPIDLTIVLNLKSGIWEVDDGADTDRGDPFAESCTRRQQLEEEKEYQRHQVGTHYKISTSLKSSFRKRHAQDDDYNYEAAEFMETRKHCVKEHEHCEACFQTLRMRFLESKREMWVDPSRNKCISMA